MTSRERFEKTMRHQAVDRPPIDIAGTTLTAAGASTPYLVSAAVLTVVLPVAIWLARLERRADALDPRHGPQ